ncbi:hypothetical protein PNOK_0654500 [Pyrrhoderma noxium]|uniref:Uncharacterized protein n=1 Tax=Pyrrhoderma noxium TaxID=2282107 RepID=A0A286UEW7_9AGAM|nr:hypothetical protein PNOK_0654500 [Pyrrhoderma noxium]
MSTPGITSSTSNDLLTLRYILVLALVDIAMFFFPKLRVLAVALVGIDSVLHSIIKPNKNRVCLRHSRKTSRFDNALPSSRLFVVMKNGWNEEVV